MQIRPNKLSFFYKAYRGNRANSANVKLTPKKTASGLALEAAGRRCSGSLQSADLAVQGIAADPQFSRGGGNIAIHGSKHIQNGLLFHFLETASR